MPQLIVVFDTNVLFSAAGWGGTPRRCLDSARNGTIFAVTCEQILEELAQKLTHKLGFSDRQTLETTAFLTTFMRVVAVPGTLQGACPDPKDDMVLECAVVAEATHLVSGDKKHLLAIKEYHGVAILSPAQLLTLVEASAG